MSPTPPDRPRPIRYAMVGGGEGAFIGAVHRMAATLAGNCVLVSGAFSADADKSRRSGGALGLDPARVHPSWQALLADEAARPAEERIAFVTVAAPNHLHAPVAIAALEAGFAVLIDKPLAERLEAAEAIAAAAARTGGLVGVTHTYTGYPMVKQMRDLVAEGAIGAIRRVSVSYTQGGMAEPAVRAAWKIDPVQAGEAGTLADIGTHAVNLVEYVTGERVSAVTAELRTAMAGRLLDDDAAALFRLAGGARGTLVASQVCVGDINRLDLAVHGETGSLRWRQEDPNHVTLGRLGRPAEIWTAGSKTRYLGDTARAAARVPAGHPEGYIEAFANLYHAFGEAVAGRPGVGDPGFATLEDALSTLRFVRAARTSSEAGGIWVSL